MSWVQLILIGVALPALVAGALQVALGRVRGGSAPRTGPRSGPRAAPRVAPRAAGGTGGDATPSSAPAWSPARGALAALAAGYAAADGALQGWPALPPADSTRWTFWAALALALLGLASALRPGTRVLAAARLAVALALPPLVLRPLLGSSWTAAEGALWACGLALGLGGLAASTGALVSRRDGAAMPLALWATSAGSSLALVLSGSLLQGQLSGAIAAALGAVVVLQWVWPGSHAGRGLGEGVATLLGALWISGRFYSELPVSSAALLVLSLASPWAARLWPAGRLSPRGDALLRLALAAAPAALAVLLAWLASPPIDEYGY